MSTPLRLNLGCGGLHLAGWLNVDAGPSVHGQAPDMLLDLLNTPWPWPALGVDEAALSHVLEHFTREDGIRVLVELRRVLDIGGKLHLGVPDMDLFIRARLDGNPALHGNYHWDSLDTCLGGDATELNPLQRHRYMYNEASLTYTLQQVGFQNVRRRPEPAPWDNPRHAAFSLYLDATA